MSEDDQNRRRPGDADTSEQGLDVHEGADRPSLDALASDLRRVVGMRTPTALRDAHLPALSVYLEAPDDPDRRLDELRHVVTRAIDAIDDPQFRDAAESLVGFGDNRWTPLRQRGERASASFNCSFDAYRRARRSTGVSLLDETVRQLAQAVDASTTAAVPPIGTDAATPNAPGDRGPVVRRRTVLVAGAAAIVVVIAAIAVAIATRGGSGAGTEAAATTTVTAHSSTSKPGRRCSHAIGATTDPALRPYRVPFATQIAQLTPPGERAPCAASPMLRWDELVLQPLTDGGRPDGALVATDPDHVMVMTEAEYMSYHQIGGKDGTQAQALAGLPRRRAMSTSGKVWLIITDHGAMASAGPDQPGFYLGGPVWTNWQRNGEDTGDWGIPASNPLNNAVGYYQDFSKGRLTLSYTGDLMFHPVGDPSASLPPDAEGQILRHDDGTTWYIDQHDVRHWIPDGATWECIHDRGSREIGHVPGYAVTTLKLGDPATCSAGN